MDKNIIYKYIKGCVKNNNLVSAKYNITRGIRQGCPLSCLNFVIAVELLATKLRSDTRIEGFKVSKKHIKIAQLADDTTLFLKFNEIKTALEIVKEFGIVSGLNLNIDKTEGILLGKNKSKKSNSFGVKWTNIVKSLGVYF